MNSALWIVQGILVFTFLMNGSIKLMRSKSQLSKQMPVMSDLPAGFIRFTGVAELLGALGVILPALTGILPVLTPLAAIGFVLIMIGAILAHSRRREWPMVAMNLVILAMAAFVAYGRLVAAPL